VSCNLLEVRRVHSDNAFQRRRCCAPRHVLLPQRSLRESEQLVDALIPTRNRRRQTPLGWSLPSFPDDRGLRRSIPSLLEPGSDAGCAASAGASSKCCFNSSAKPGGALCRCAHVE
jgi:hypothetical protein